MELLHKYLEIIIYHDYQIITLFYHIRIKLTLKTRDKAIGSFINVNEVKLLFLIKF